MAAIDVPNVASEGALDRAASPALWRSWTASGRWNANGAKEAEAVEGGVEVEGDKDRLDGKTNGVPSRLLVTGTFCSSRKRLKGISEGASVGESTP